MASEAAQQAPREPWRNETFVDRLASRHYRLDLLRPDLGLGPDFELPVHNYQHAKGTGIEAVTLAKKAAEQGVTDIDMDVLGPMGSWHDAGYALRPGIDQTFGTRESYSADMAGRDLLSLGMPRPKVKLTREGIESTAVGVRCKSNTARCFRQADLRNLRGKPIAFLNVTYRLFREQQILDGQPIIPITVNPSRVMKDLVQFAGISHEILTAYLEEDISLGDFDRNEKDESLFAIDAAKNVELLVPTKITDILSKNLGRIVTYTPVGL